MEEFIDGEGSTFYIKRTFDPNPTLDRVKDLRSSGVFSIGESYHVGSVPGWMVDMWLKEAGVRWDQAEERNEIVRKKLQSGDYSLLRNWQGSF